ncbi:MAG: stress protein [Epulopiscium sp. Nele67-Bin004]|nr:MAG: stress protein [Epulopiscium sp. Nele67-Bin004]
MAVSLQKGQRVSLKKENGSALEKIVVGLGWDQANAKRGLFKKASQPIDCDASVFVLDGDKLRHKDDIIYFGNLGHRSNSIIHMGDNLTGEGDGDDEQIRVDLTSVPANFNKLVIVVNIYQADVRNQDFGQIENAFIRIVDSANNQEMFRYNLTEDYAGQTAMIFGEIYRNNGEWKFNPMGQGTTDLGLNTLANRFV